MEEDQFSNISKILAIGEECDNNTVPCKHLIKFITITGEEIWNYWSGAEIAEFYLNNGDPPPSHFEIYKDFTRFRD